jgi:hypothetical protein
MKQFWAQLSQKIEELFEFLGPLLFFGWIVAVIFLPNFEASDQSLFDKFATSENFRAILMRGDNLRFYVTRDVFESVPYPDRSGLMKEIAAEWCKKASYTFLPSVYLYDIKTGEGLGSYNCAVGRIKTRWGW